MSGSLHEPDTEHRHDLKLLPRVHLQLGQHRQRQCQDNQVKHNFDASADKAEESDVDGTFASHLSFPSGPKERYRHALKQHRERVTKAEAGNKGHKHPDDGLGGA